MYDNDHLLIILNHLKLKLKTNHHKITFHKIIIFQILNMLANYKRNICFHEDK